MNYNFKISTNPSTWQMNRPSEIFEIDFANASCRYSAGVFEMKTKIISVDKQLCINAMSCLNELKSYKPMLFMDSDTIRISSEELNLSLSSYDLDRCTALLELNSIMDYCRKVQND